MEMNTKDMIRELRKAFLEGIARAHAMSSDRLIGDGYWHKIAAEKYPYPKKKVYKEVIDGPCIYRFNDERDLIEVCSIAAPTNWVESAWSVETIRAINAIIDAPYTEVEDTDD